MGIIAASAGSMKVACVVLLLCLLGMALANPMRRLKNKRGYSFVKKAMDMHKQKRGPMGESPSWEYFMRNSSCVDADAIEDEVAAFEQAIEDGDIEGPKTKYDLSAAMFRGILGTPASCFQHEGMVEVCTGLALGMRAMIESHIRMDVAVYLATNPEALEELGVESLDELAELGSLDEEEIEDVGSLEGVGSQSGPGRRGPGGNGPRGGSSGGSGERGPGRGGPRGDGPP